MNNLEVEAASKKRRKDFEKKDRKLILKLAASVQHPQIYSLGITDRYGISIVEQQLKAFLLAKTLIEAKKINRNKRIAVIGSGVAGLSFAVAVATKTNCEVTVFEKEKTVLPLLARVHWRWVVPFYDFVQSHYFSEKTSLPFLNWEADYAWKVARNLTRKWQVYKSNFSIKEALNVSVQIPSQIPVKAPRLLINGKTKTFDIVIVATGFGQVEELSKKDNYWLSGHPESYRPKIPNEKVLISGNGDAGLVELFHFCIKDFYHDDILRFYDWNASGTTLHYLTDSMKNYRDQILSYNKGLFETAEQKLYFFGMLQSPERKAVKEKVEQMSNGQKLNYVDDYYRQRIAELKNDYDKMFKTLRFSDIYLDFLSKHISKSFLITLNGVDELLFNAEKEVNPHNMILASALYRLGAFKYVSGRLTKSKHSKNSNQTKVKIGTAEATFDRLIVRHGKVPNSIDGLIFHSFIEQDDGEEPLSWASIINRNDKDFYHSKEIKKFVVLNYLDEVDTVTAREVMTNKWGERK